MMKWAREPTTHDAFAPTTGSLLFLFTLYDIGEILALCLSQHLSHFTFSLTQNSVQDDSNRDW